jgi:D-3-phosphoglycerate dehydrogenase
MVTVFVSHPPDKLDTYFGAKATQALAAIAKIRFNDAPGDVSLPELVAAARGCEALIAYRQTAAPEALFRELPELFAFIRCAVDIRTGRRRRGERARRAR